MEVKVFREPLAIGLVLMVVWFMKKLDGNVGKAIVTEAGEKLPGEALKPRRGLVYPVQSGRCWPYPRSFVVWCPGLL
ncbi:MAG: hypothetical protein FJ291_30940 [Planctomycetes bacterium]|nr:hypothetical protein [Planctomycetota bacterium]